VDESSLSRLARSRPARHVQYPVGSMAMRRDAALRSLVSARGVDPVSAHGRESRVCLSTRARRLGAAPRKCKAPHLRRCAGGAITRRRVASRQWLEPGLGLAAGDQRPRVHAAHRRLVVRGDRRPRKSETAHTDGQGSHRRHPRHTRPRRGETGEVAIRRTRDGRAAGP